MLQTIDPSQLNQYNPFEGPEPWSEEAEQHILGAILQFSDVMPTVAGLLKPEHFYSARHREIYSACLRLYTDSEPITIITVSELCKDRGSLQDIGGRTYINNLILSVLTSFEVPYYCEIVKDNAMRRALRQVGLTIFTQAAIKPANETLSWASQAVQMVSTEQQIGKERTYQDQLDATLARIKAKLVDGVPAGMPTGYALLDEEIGGLRPHSLNIIAARTSVGKTTFSMNLIANVLKMDLGPVWFFSFEMADEDLLEHMFWMWADSQKNYTTAQEAHRAMSEKPLRVIKKDHYTVEQIRSECLRLKMEEGQPALIVVDYIGKIPASTIGRKFNNPNEVITHISSRLKSLAGEMNCPIVVPCQINRQGATEVPELHHLKDSGSIEADADVVIMLHNTDVERKHLKDLYIKKNRCGRAGGKISYTFNDNTMRFTEQGKPSYWNGGVSCDVGF